VAVTAVAVGVGSAVMVQASKISLLSKIPAIVWGFASTVGTAAATGHDITTTSLSNPALVAALAMVLGAVFGIASQYAAVVMTARSAAPAAEPATEGRP
jgi:hypothetical protein